MNEAKGFALQPLDCQICGLLAKAVFFPEADDVSASSASFLETYKHIGT
jgi:hypothetical protein